MTVPGQSQPSACFCQQNFIGTLHVNLLTHTVYCCFPTLKAELSSWDRDTKSKMYIYYLAFYRKFSDPCHQLQNQIKKKEVFKLNVTLNKLVSGKNYNSPLYISSVLGEILIHLFCLPSRFLCVYFLFLALCSK